MASLLTNISAMTALQTLAQVNRNVDTTQTRISTGRAVNEAADNAAYWSIATTMRSDNGALSAVQDALGLAAATIDVQYTALNSTVDLLTEISKRLVAARNPGLPRTKIQADITQLLGQIRTAADASVFNGENWLSVDSGAPGYNAIKSSVSSYTRQNGTVVIQTLNIDITNIKLYDPAGGTPDGLMDRVRTATSGPSSPVTGQVDTVAVNAIDISAITDAPADLTTLENYIVIVDQTLQELTSAATDLGSVKKRVDMQSSFMSSLRDAIDRGIGQLVDADLNKESTRLKAYQAQQQLAIQALSIANTGSQNILALFRN